MSSVCAPPSTCYLRQMCTRWILVLGWGLLLSTPALGGEAEAERNRLQEELVKLSQKNTWSGVERIFLQLEALHVPLSVEDHFLGAQASMESGDMLTALRRLQAGLSTVDPSEPSSVHGQARSLLGEIQARYGLVHIVIHDEEVVPALFRSPMPFSSQERQAIAHAQAKLVERRSFMGLLPSGQYRLDVEEIEVGPGEPMREIRFGR